MAENGGRTERGNDKGTLCTCAIDGGRKGTDNSLESIDVNIVSSRKENCDGKHQVSDVECINLHVSTENDVGNWQTGS